MVRCEQGYLCEVCGLEVEDVTGSDLYLRYVLGEVDPETLHVQPERHLACNPTLAQFIVADGFPAVVVTGPFAKSELDPEFVAEDSLIDVRFKHAGLRSEHQSSRYLSAPRNWVATCRLV